MPAVASSKDFDKSQKYTHLDPKAAYIYASSSSVNRDWATREMGSTRLQMSVGGPC
jgi:hypothetical protein